MSLAATWPKVITGERASIRQMDAQTIDADWLDEAAQAIAGRGTPCRLRDRLDDGDQGWWILGENGESDTVVGALCGKLIAPTDSVTGRALVWTWLAIDARWRAYGYGGLAVPLLEQAAARLGATLALTPLPADNGVALYFWLRLGYVPLRSAPVSMSDWPIGAAADALWMQRSLSTA